MGLEDLIKQASKTLISKAPVEFFYAYTRFLYMLSGPKGVVSLYKTLGFEVGQTPIQIKEDEKTILLGYSISIPDSKTMIKKVFDKVFDYLKHPEKLPDDFIMYMFEGSPEFTEKIITPQARKRAVEYYKKKALIELPKKLFNLGRKNKPK